jgi:hypothetical protein
MKKAGQKEISALFNDGLVVVLPLAVVIDKICEHASQVKEKSCLSTRMSWDGPTKIITR